jgi:hypothetical protein
MVSRLEEGIGKKEERSWSSGEGTMRWIQEKDRLQKETKNLWVPTKTTATNVISQCLNLSRTSLFCSPGSNSGHSKNAFASVNTFL